MPTCDMDRSCKQPITHMDFSGWVYCTDHGVDRRHSGVPCRKLRPHELNRVRRGENVSY